MTLQVNFYVIVTVGIDVGIVIDTVLGTNLGTNLSMLIGILLRLVFCMFLDWHVVHVHCKNVVDITDVAGGCRTEATRKF